MNSFRLFDKSVEEIPLYEEIDRQPGYDSWYLTAWLASGGEPEVRTFLTERKLNYLSDASAWHTVGIARIHLFLDEPDSAVTWLEKVQVENVEGLNGNRAYDMAKIYYKLGDQESGLHWLNRAYELRGSNMLSIQLDWELDGWRDHPGFEAIVRKVGFPES